MSLACLFWEDVALVIGMVSYIAKGITKLITKKPNKQIGIENNNRIKLDELER